MPFRIQVCVGVMLQLLLAGCQALLYGTTSELEWLGIGMTKDQVIRVLGSPLSSRSFDYKNEEHLYFKKVDKAFTGWPRTFRVVFHYNRVVRWSEETDFRRY